MHHHFDESDDVDDGKKVVLNGDYLCIQYDEHPLHVYKRVAPGEEPHPFIARAEHDGQVYRLAWIEEDKE